MSHLQQQAQKKDAEFHRELQALRVRICDKSSDFITIIVAAVVSVYRDKKMSSWLQCRLNFNRCM